MLTSLFLWLPCSSMARLPESPSVHLIFSIGSRDRLCPGIWSRVLTIFGCRHCISRSVSLLPFGFYLGLLLGFLEEKPSSPTAHRPPPKLLCPFTFLTPAKIPGSLSQVRKRFSSTQPGNFSEPPLPLAHSLCLGRTQKAREFFSLLSVGPRVGMPTVPNI